MGISDVIAGFIQSALDETDGVLELQRSDLAQRFNCVPSQINYVMSTRFSPEHGYIVESRRGGNGYIRITRVRTDRKTLLMHVINSIGDELDAASARAIVQNLVDSEAISAGGTVSAGRNRRPGAAPGGQKLPRHAAQRYLQAGIDPFGLIFPKEVMIYEMRTLWP